MWPCASSWDCFGKIWLNIDVYIVFNKFLNVGPAHEYKYSIDFWYKNQYEFLMWRIRIELTNTCATNKRLTILPYVTIMKWCSWWLQRFSPSLASVTSVTKLHRGNISSQQRGWYTTTKCTWGERFRMRAVSFHNPMPITGLEPVTLWLQIRCSTNWAKSAKCSWYVVAQDISLTPDPKRDQTTLFEKGIWSPKNCSDTEDIERSPQ